MNKREFVPKENKLKTSRKPIDEASLLKGITNKRRTNCYKIFLVTSQDTSTGCMQCKPLHCPI